MLHYNFTICVLFSNYVYMYITEYIRIMVLTKKKLIPFRSNFVVFSINRNIYFLNIRFRNNILKSLSRKIHNEKNCQRKLKSHYQIDEVCLRLSVLVSISPSWISHYSVKTNCFQFCF